MAGRGRPRGSRKKIVGPPREVLSLRAGFGLIGRPSHRTEALKQLAYQPREELPYTDFYSDLDPSKSLRVVFASKNQVISDPKEISEDYGKRGYDDSFQESSTFNYSNGGENSDNESTSGGNIVLGQGNWIKEDSPFVTDSVNDDDQNKKTSVADITLTSADDKSADIISENKADLASSTLPNGRPAIDPSLLSSQGDADTQMDLKEVEEEIPEEMTEPMKMEEQYLRRRLLPTPPELPKVSIRLADPFHMAYPKFSKYLLSWGYLPEELTHAQDELYYRNKKGSEIIEPERVKYDLDEQDYEWLLDYKERDPSISKFDLNNETFEIFMTCLETEWNIFEKIFPAQETKEEPVEPVEDARCDICDDGECENSNAIVFCDGCNLAVHQDCYGIPFIPEGQWLCRKCQVIPHVSPSCILCPNTGGAFKQTVDGQWVHLLCALWVPETIILNSIFMEPIDHIEMVPRQRYSLLCYICKRKVGAPIQCAKTTCFAAFHPTCAREARLQMLVRGKMSEAHNDMSNFRAYCDKHCTEEHKKLVGQDKALKAAQEHYHKLKLTKSSSSNQTKKITLNINKTPGVTRLPSSAPLVPEKIVKTIISNLSDFRFTRRTDVLYELCKYWTLKREERRGAALIKHSPPQIDTYGSRKPSHRYIEKKLEISLGLDKAIKSLLSNLEKLKEREHIKLELAHVQKIAREKIFFPVQVILLNMYDQMKRLDSNGIFAKVVPEEKDPYYHATILHPISLTEIGQRLYMRKYRSVYSFEADIKLLFDNYFQYNESDNESYDAAVILKSNYENLIVEARKKESIIPYSDQGNLKVVPFLEASLQQIFETEQFQYPTPPAKAEETIERTEALLWQNELENTNDLSDMADQSNEGMSFHVSEDLPEDSFGDIDPNLSIDEDEKSLSSYHEESDNSNDDYDDYDDDDDGYSKRKKKSTMKNSKRQRSNY